MKRRGYGSQQTDLSELRSQMKQRFIGLLPTHIDGNVRMAGKYKLESEQYHSEIKTDMDVGRLPSGKFESNKLVLGADKKCGDATCIIIIGNLRFRIRQDQCKLFIRINFFVFLIVFNVFSDSID